MLLEAAVILAQTESGCPAGQTPQFDHGFAFLKSQLGEVMGEPVECEQYDAEWFTWSLFQPKSASVKLPLSQG
jgi:hypothetical protein